MDNFLGAIKTLIIPKLSMFIALEGSRIHYIINNHPQLTRLKLYAAFDPVTHHYLSSKNSIYWFEHVKHNSAGRLSDKIDNIYQILAGRDSLVYLCSIMTYWHPSILNFLAENIKNVVTLSFLNIASTPSDASTNTYGTLQGRIVWTCVNSGVWVSNTRGTQEPPANQ
ncbi:hypothetical protein Hypma_005252 [Hypsizygus marmoreus]|uniref:Uncharacterized protein n=1 Tax=Hypsizygus marmoreus TaxID=39966 RepID=A0A369K2E4_HYPMA|nr:hypothetical protein Hypma_005252 [Hypsizygus marmoreus]